MMSSRSRSILGDQTCRSVNCPNDGDPTLTSRRDMALWDATQEIHLILACGQSRAQDLKRSTIAQEEAKAKAKVRELVLKRGASVNHALLLHRAVANGFEKQIIQFLVLEMGGDVNRQDKYGSTPLHQAAANHSAAIPWLLELGANSRVVDYNGKKAIHYLQKSWKGYVKIYRDDYFAVPPIHCKNHLQYVLALMPSQETRHLVSNWLSPRMRYQLLCCAELEGDALSDGTGNLSYLPNDLYQKNRNESSFIEGYQACFVAAAVYLKNGKVPTVERILTSSLWNMRKYLQLGGKIEYALDAIIDLTDKCEDPFWEDSDDYQALPETALDDAYEIARAMCINYGGGELKEIGPYGERFQDDPDLQDHRNNPLFQDYYYD